MKFTTIFSVAAFTVSVLYTQRAEKQQFLTAPSETPSLPNSTNSTLVNSTQTNNTSGNSTSVNSTETKYKFGPKRAAVLSRQANIENATVVNSTSVPASNPTVNNATIVNSTTVPANNATMASSAPLTETVAPASNATVNNVTVANTTAVPASNNTQNVTEPGWNKFVSNANDSLRNVTAQISDFFHGGVKSTDNNTPLGGKK